MAQVTWEIKGRVRVEVDEATELRDSQGNIERLKVTGDLGNMEIEVEGSLLPTGGFARWGTTTTKEDGTFSLKVEKSQAARNIRVKVRFRNTKLEVTPGLLADPLGWLSPGWNTIYESPSKRDGPGVNIGTRTFSKGAEGDLGKRNHYRQAVAWYLCETIMDRLVKKDPWFAYKKKITVVCPANVVSGVPYANGVTRAVYIHSTDKNDKWWGPDTVIHEIMHLWNYDHNYGTSNWLQAICDGSTHSFQEKPAIAFHEGFAEYAKDDMLHQIWGLSKVQPLDRKSLRNGNRQDLPTLQHVEGSDDGVTNALHLLTTPNIYGRYFGTRTSPTPSDPYAGQLGALQTAALSCPRSPDITLWDVLKVFKAAPQKGWKTAWQVGTASYGLLRFFERAEDILDGLDEDTKSMYLSLLDAGATTEPQDRCTRR